MSRIDPIMKNLIGNENPDDLAQEILEVLTEGINVPEAGNFYVFVYQPKTPNIRYDAHPLVAVTDVFQWGFKGLNFHWGEMRQYTFNTPHSGSRCSDWCGQPGAYRVTKVIGNRMYVSQSCFSGYSPGTSNTINVTNFEIYFREK